MTTNPYLLDILSQPASMKAALEKFDPEPLAPLSAALRHGDFDRLVLTGMGGSLYACYPTWLLLASAGLPAMWVDTSELIHHMPGLVTSRTLLWLFSQSGKSAEIVSVLDFERVRRPGALLATVNDPGSPLAQAAASFGGPSASIWIQAEVEKTVSTRTYINSLAVSQLGALALLGREELESARGAMLLTGETMQKYLFDGEERVQRIGEQIGFPKRLAILGRGSSMAAAYTGTLILGEAAKFMATPYQTGEFRHGPLELANPDLTALIFAGPEETRELNWRLFRELQGYQVNTFWIGGESHERQIELPEVPPIGRPLMEILPIQLLSIHLARQIGIEPGEFFHSGKITLSE
jgi:glutamine---fructose-6-phosphate transaminase (isomerizing)